MYNVYTSSKQFKYFSQSLLKRETVDFDFYHDNISIYNLFVVLSENKAVLVN